MNCNADIGAYLFLWCKGINLREQINLKETLWLFKQALRTPLPYFVLFIPTLLKYWWNLFKIFYNFWDSKQILVWDLNLMMTINCFCCMVDWQTALSLISSQGHCPRDPHHCESPTRCEQNLNLRRTWVHALLNEVLW